MAAPYQHKRSTTAAAVPTILDGELGINQRDGKLFWKDHNGTVQSKLLTSEAATTTTTGALINGATAKTTPVDADQVGLMDSAASNVLKKLSWANIKATLKTYFDGLYKPAPFALTDGATISIDASVAEHFYVTLGGDRTFAAPTNPVDGRKMLLEITQDGTGSRTRTMNGAFFYPSGTASVLSTAAGKKDFELFIYSARSSKWEFLAFRKGS